jgi:hypothetical protein
MSSAPAAGGAASAVPVPSNMQIQLNVAWLSLRNLPINSSHEEIYKKLGVTVQYMKKLRDYFDPNGIYEPGYNKVEDLTKILMDNEQTTRDIPVLGENVKIRKIMILFVLGVLKHDDMSFETWMTSSEDHIKEYVNNLWGYIHSVNTTFSVADVYDSEITSQESEVYDDLQRTEKDIPSACFMSKLNSSIQIIKFTHKVCVLDNISSKDQCFKYDPVLWHVFFMWCFRDKSQLKSYAMKCGDKRYIFLANVPKFSNMTPPFNDKNDALFKMIKDPYTLIVGHLKSMKLKGTDDVHIISRTRTESCYSLLVCVHVLTLVVLGDYCEFFADTDFFDESTELLGCIRDKKPSAVLSDLVFDTLLTFPLHFPSSMTEVQIEAVASEYLEKMKYSNFVYDNTKINNDQQYLCTLTQQIDHLDYILSTCHIQYNWLFQDSRLTKYQSWLNTLFDEMKGIATKSFHIIGVYRRILHLMRRDIDTVSSFSDLAETFFDEPAICSKVEYFDKLGFVTFDFSNFGINKTLFKAQNARSSVLPDELMDVFCTINNRLSNYLKAPLQDYFKNDDFNMFDFQFKFLVFEENNNQYFVRDTCQLKYMQEDIITLNFQCIKECPSCGKIQEPPMESWYKHIANHDELRIMKPSSGSNKSEVTTPVRSPAFLPLKPHSVHTSPFGSRHPSRAPSGAGGSGGTIVSGGNFGSAMTEVETERKRFEEILASLRTHHESTKTYIDKASRSMSGSSSGTKAVLDELTQALRQLEAAEKLLNETIEQRDQRIRDLQGELADESNKFIQLQEDLTQKEAELKTAKDDLQTAKDELQTATKNIQDLKAAAVQSADELTKTQENLSDIQTKFSQKEAELTRNQDDHNQLIAQKDKTIQEKEADLTAVNGKLKAIENELKDSKDNLSTAQLQFDTDKLQFDTDKAALEKEILDLQTKAASTVSAPPVQDDTVIKALEAKLKLAEQENKELKTKFAAEEKMVHEMVAELRKMNDLLNQELGISTTRTSTAIDGLHQTTKTILKQYTQHAKLNDLFLAVMNADLETGKQKRKVFFDKVTAGNINQKEYSPIALFLMYESMAATWYLFKSKYVAPNATDEDKESVLEKIIYDFRQWKTIKNHTQQKYHSKYFKEFIEFWDLKGT